MNTNTHVEHLDPCWIRINLKSLLWAVGSIVNGQWPLLLLWNLGMSEKQPYLVHVHHVYHVQVRNVHEHEWESAGGVGKLCIQGDTQKSTLNDHNLSTKNANILVFSMTFIHSFMKVASKRGIFGVFQVWCAEAPWLLCQIFLQFTQLSICHHIMWTEFSRVENVYIINFAV